MVDLVSTEQNRAHAQELSDAAHRLSVLLDLPHGRIELKDWSDQLQARLRKMFDSQLRLSPRRLPEFSCVATLFRWRPSREA
jgi:hypothetical protein